MTLYDKNEAADLTAPQKKTLKALLELELAERTAKRVMRPGIQGGFRWRR